MSECRIQLRRDTVNTAWGFRLQGGHEYGSPLFVQRVSNPPFSCHKHGLLKHMPTVRENAVLIGI